MATVSQDMNKCRKEFLKMMAIFFNELAALFNSIAKGFLNLAEKKSQGGDDE